jgi:hypothetical protein
MPMAKESTVSLAGATLRRLVRARRLAVRQSQVSGKSESRLSRSLKELMAASGYALIERPPPVPVDIGHDAEAADIIGACTPFTMTSPERMYALIQSARHVALSGVHGSIVECGVWRGGSSMVAAKTLVSMGNTDREIYLYDTFAGMPQPTGLDVDQRAVPAAKLWSSSQREGYNAWCYAPLEEVRSNMESTGYPMDRVFFVKGKVEETIPGTVPEAVAILRIDTDWYESYRHILAHLYARLSPGGLLFLDDYGGWQGARRAVDDFLATLPKPPLLHRIDGSLRVAVNA